MKTPGFLLLLAGITMSAGQVHAQKTYNQWYFGRKAGLDFNTKQPTVITNSAMTTPEGSSSACDASGNLLFYTDGDTIWNRNHMPMLNWKSSLPFQRRESSIQGSMIVPVPGSDHLWYIIMCPSYEDRTRDSLLSYWTVDMNADGGLGAVIEKEKPLFRIWRENFGLAKHANGTDYWVAGMDNERGFFYCARTSNGVFVTPPVKQKAEIQTMLMNCPNNKFSRDSKLFAAQLNAQIINGVPHYYYNIFKFDNSAGLIHSRIRIHVDSPWDVYASLEFSANSRFLYVHQLDRTVFPYTTRLLQYDLQVWDSASINASVVEIFTSKVLNETVHGLQLGPDGRIYAFNSNSDKISVIDYPDMKGLACSYRNRSIDIAPKRTVTGGPYYPIVLMDIKPVNLGADTVLCEGDTLLLRSGAGTGDNIRWNTGDTTPDIQVTGPGMYSVIVNNVYMDTIRVKTGKKFRVYLGPDTAFCKKFTHLLSAGSGAKSYNWNTGETTETIMVDRKGLYMVKVTDSNSCPAGDTIIIDRIEDPVIRIRYDSLTCRYVFLSADRQQGVAYNWSNGDTGVMARVDKKGTYTVHVSNRFCSTSGTVSVTMLPKPEVNIGDDRFFCKDNIVLWAGANGKYVWNTGDTTAHLVVTKPGKYWVTVTRNGCMGSDTINLALCEDMAFYIPGAFSPNADGANDVFRVYGDHIEDMSIEVYNRWGEKIAVTEGKNASWDGTYRGETCQEGAYMYLVAIKGYQGGVLRTFYKSGTLTLLK